MQWKKGFVDLTCSSNLCCIGSMFLISKFIYPPLCCRWVTTIRRLPPTSIKSFALLLFAPWSYCWSFIASAKQRSSQIRTACSVKTSPAALISRSQTVYPSGRAAFLVGIYQHGILCFVYAQIKITQEVCVTWNRPAVSTTCQSLSIFFTQPVDFSTFSTSSRWSLTKLVVGSSAVVLHKSLFTPSWGHSEVKRAVSHWRAAQFVQLLFPDFAFSPWWRLYLCFPFALFPFSVSNRNFPKVRKRDGVWWDNSNTQRATLVLQTCIYLCSEQAHTGSLIFPATHTQSTLTALNSQRARRFMSCARNR